MSMLVELLEAEMAEKRRLFEPFAETLAAAMEDAIDRGLGHDEITQALLEFALARIVEEAGARSALDVLRLYHQIAEKAVAQLELAEAAPAGRA
jgi:2-oxo-4-hydroxy-4-carboxy--5-ureidoimidazoline (OHCU) decarboxylase